MFQPTSDDLMVQELLQLQLKDHLQGGYCDSVTYTVLIEKTRSVPLSNVAPEQNFAVLDRLISHKPNATTIVLESIIYSHNKTSIWLKNEPQSEKKNYRSSTYIHQEKRLNRCVLKWFKDAKKRLKEKARKN